MSAINLTTASPDVLALQADAFQMLINVLELKKGKVLTAEQADLIVEQTLIRLGLAEPAPEAETPETAPPAAVPPAPEAELDDEEADKG